ncbi:hypothetical protein MYX78_06400 [Acidobacteria bacterium AH-259-G07]|nr:hypothetical protein [Acidobacteria bacterium AH-259-G07]
MDQPAPPRPSEREFQLRLLKETAQGAAGKLEKLGLGSRTSLFLGWGWAIVCVLFAIFLVLSWTLAGWCGYDPWV